MPRPSRPGRRTGPDPEGQEAAPPVRLQKYLADCGVASRRACEAIIAEGRVTVNGVVVDEMGAKVTPGFDRVALDARPVRPPRLGHVYYALHKPRGYVVTADDPDGRRTIYDLLSAVRTRVVPVGRLDRDSEGLLLLTNDGELANRLMHPKWKVEKEYEVVVEGKLPDDALDTLRAGLEIDEGVVTGPASVRVLPPGQGALGRRIVGGSEMSDRYERGGFSDEDLHDFGTVEPLDEDEEALRVEMGLKPARRGAKAKEGATGRAAARAGDAGGEGRPMPRTRLSMVLSEGRKRQVREMIAAVGCRVTRLVRVREGSITLEGLAVGRVRALTADEVRRVKRDVGLAK